MLDWSLPEEMSFKLGKFTFDNDQELVRRAGSDWLKDSKGKLRKARSWKPAEGRWDLTDVGRHTMASTAQSLWSPYLATI